MSIRSFLAVFESLVWTTPMDEFPQPVWQVMLLYPGIALTKKKREAKHHTSLLWQQHGNHHQSSICWVSNLQLLWEKVIFWRFTPLKWPLGMGPKTKKKSITCHNQFSKSHNLGPVNRILFNPSPRSLEQPGPNKDPKRIIDEERLGLKSKCHLMPLVWFDVLTDFGTHTCNFWCTSAAGKLSPKQSYKILPAARARNHRRTSPPGVCSIVWKRMSFGLLLAPTRPAVLEEPPVSTVFNMPVMSVHNRLCFPFILVSNVSFPTTLHAWPWDRLEVSAISAVVSRFTASYPGLR